MPLRAGDRSSCHVAPSSRATAACGHAGEEIHSPRLQCESDRPRTPNSLKWIALRGLTLDGFEVLEGRRAP